MDAGMNQKTKADAPYCSPPPIHRKNWYFYLAEDSKLMETEAGKIQTKVK